MIMCDTMQRASELGISADYTDKYVHIAIRGDGAHADRKKKIEQVTIQVSS